MSESILKCYMCECEGTTKEHVPPRCFFPKQKRVNLFTVPSCKKHNCRKSNIDQMMMNFFHNLKVLEMKENMSALHFNHSNNPSKGFIFLPNYSKKISFNNIHLFLDTFARAIYFKVQGRSTSGVVSGYLHHYRTGICFEFGHGSRNLEDDEDLRHFRDRRDTFHLNMIANENSVEIGDNKDIFKSEYISMDSGRMEVIKSTFFEDIEVWSEYRNT